jgi:quercetin dioxygenase-like cupin family protein
MLSIPISLRPFVCCVAAVLVLPGLAAPRGGAAQSTRGPAAGAEGPSGPPLRSAVFPADTGRLRVTDVAMFRGLVDTLTSNLSRLEIHVTTLAPGKAPHPPHRHAHEELMILRNGTLDVFQNGATRRVGPGAVIFEAANELHGLRNPGPDSATYVVIRIEPHDLPRPAGASR